MPTKQDTMFTAKKAEISIHLVHFESLVVVYNESLRHFVPYLQSFISSSRLYNQELMQEMKQ